MDSMLQIEKFRPYTQHAEDLGNCNKIYSIISLQFIL